MAHYIDGFVLPVPRDHLDEYKRIVEAVAEIWKEHGALKYCEYAAVLVRVVLGNRELFWQ